jgi:hypothetical protein
MNPPVPAVEIEVYAPGLREQDRILQLSHQMDLLPGLRYKVDTLHEMVYFEADQMDGVSQSSIVEIFESIGIHPRFVGDVSSTLPVHA